MQSGNKPSRLLLVVAVSGLAVGLCGEFSERELDSPQGGLLWGAFGFLFFIVCSAAAALFERMFLALGTRLRWVANPCAARLNPDRRSFATEKYFGCFIIFMGVG